MPKKNTKTYAFDVDGVICFSNNGNYEKSKPYVSAIKKINQLYSDGHRIIIFTARYMGRTNNNIEKAKQLGYEKTFQQLQSWGLHFHELFMGKPSYDILIDDKAFNYNENWIDKL